MRDFLKGFSWGGGWIIYMCSTFRMSFRWSSPYLLKLQEITDFQKLGVKWETHKSLGCERLTGLINWGTVKTTKVKKKIILNLSSTTVPRVKSVNLKSSIELSSTLIIKL